MIPSTKTVLLRLARHRTFQKRIAGINQPAQYEVFSVAGVHHYHRCNTMKHAMMLASKTAREQPGTVVSIWSPLRGHVYQAVVHNGQYTVLHGGAPSGAPNRGGAPSGEQASRQTSEPTKETIE